MYNYGTASLSGRKESLNHSPAVPISMIAEFLIGDSNMKNRKVCSTCKTDKPITEFTQRSGRPIGQFKSSCNPCLAKKQTSYRKANPKKVSASYKKWYAKNKGKRSEDWRAWYAANKERRAEYWSAYYQDNHSEMIAKRKRQHAVKVLRYPSWLTRAHKKSIEDIYEERARISEETGVLHHVDHIVPLQGELVSGLHVPWNLQVMPADENLTKGNRYSV